MATVQISASTPKRLGPSAANKPGIQTSAATIGKPKPSVRNAETVGAAAGQQAGADNNGTDIGPGNNGQLCAGGVCNEPTSYAAPIQSVGTKVNTPVMETPVTTRTVTRQMLEDQQAITIDQALKNVSGVAFSGGGDAALGNSFRQIILRGFPTQNYFRDGFRVDSFGLNFTGASNLEMANVESVEVLKGPAAILYGAVEPGGIVNVITKKPKTKPSQRIGISAGGSTSRKWRPKKTIGFANRMSGSSQ